jgi:hypothetical protein
VQWVENGARDLLTGFGFENDKALAVQDHLSQVFRCEVDQLRGVVDLQPA